MAALWNLALGPGREMLTASTSPARRSEQLDVVGTLAGVFFLLLALREWRLATTVTFGGGRLRIRTALAPWLRLELPIREIEGFEVLGQEDGRYQVRARLHGAKDRALPLSFETVPVRASWTKKAPFASPVTYASFLAARLTVMLATAKMEADP